jgi:hypothetical protein
MRTATKISLCLSLAILCAYSPGAYAVKLAPFNDKKSVQPIPIDVRPNISGNVNSSLPKSESADDNLNGLEPQSENGADKTTEGNPETNVNIYQIITLSVFAVFALILIISAKKRKERKNQAVASENQ